MAEKKKWDLNRAVNAIDRNAQRKSCGYCARYVRTAIEAGGLSTAGRPGSAYLYTSFLPKIGFQPVTQLYGKSSQSQWSASNAKPGDISVMSHGQHGHICMWDGRQWVSDFRQNNMWPYSGDGQCSIFRFTGEVTNSPAPPAGGIPPAPWQQPNSGGDGAGANGQNVFSAPQGNTLTNQENVYSMIQQEDTEKHTRIYSAFRPELQLDEMTLPQTSIFDDEEVTVIENNNT